MVRTREQICKFETCYHKAECYKVAGFYVTEIVTVCFEIGGMMLHRLVIDCIGSLNYDTTIEGLIFTTV